MEGGSGEQNKMQKNNFPRLIANHFVWFLDVVCDW